MEGLDSFRREISAAPVEGTNDSSTLSKLSTCNAGYIVDDFLKHFVERPCRRAPLIHRGYYIRWKAVDHVKCVCREWLLSCDLQIVLFGAGYDTTLFQLQSEHIPLKWRVFEVDLPAVQFRKLTTILKSQELLKYTGQLMCVSDSLAQSAVYSAIACDICDLEALRTNFEKAGVDFTAHTLFISECVLTYIDPKSVDALLAWCAASFSSAVFCTYEQILPQDVFGQIMKKHFENICSPLKNVGIYPSAESQMRRYLAAGWDLCKCSDMTAVFTWLPDDEKRRIGSLELFDEYEEWHLNCSHYMILCAFKGQLNVLKSELLPFGTKNEDVITPVYTSLRLKVNQSSCSLKRFGHASCLLSDGSVLVVGGYGESSSKGSAPHSRLNDIVRLLPHEDGQIMVCGLKTNGHSPGPLMHHTVTAICGGSAVLVIGGRASPAFAIDTMFVMKMNMSGFGQWSKVVLHPDSCLMEPRWRHSATCFNDNGEECVLVVGGCCTGFSARDDIYKLDVATWRLEKLNVSLPEGRSSHSSVASQGGVFIFGGMDISLTPISSCLYLTHPLPDVWELSTVEFSPLLPPKYSMSAVTTGELVILLGGVGLASSPDIIVVNLSLQLWFGMMMSCEGKVLLHKHTSHLVAGRKIVIIGGGGNCFSFGTHFNSGIYTLDTSSLCVYPHNVKFHCL